ncbi:SIS domain-containing protein [Halocynthiibacter sp. C4]|uniref:SIS domain-containing protein n=1 Tax=Halocynthiibacter sp. C4 TaxID=2992758 RepID=UPI00237BDBA5|nr:SIS domain-containing protein [Halocynthiibacter sp. C4]MDE0591510.1 SIS domain-containing protein [Halocynthiibacter sp. C4]
MSSFKTHMAKEIAEIPTMFERQLQDGLKQYWETGAALRSSNPRGFVTCARGTSDHAAAFFKYAFETKTGLPVASIGPSVASVYNAQLKLDRFASVAFSQSGGSPDLTKLQEAAQKGGAETIAILNVVDSPLARASNSVLPIYAGPENAVAATKSYVGMLFASLGILAGFTEDKALQSDLSELPDLARAALAVDWSAATVPVARSGSLFCIGRGPSFAIAAESALKFKETCRLHAEAYSAAEVLHGPVAIAGDRFAALLFSSGDMAADSITAAKEKLEHQGAAVFEVGGIAGPKSLPSPRSRNPLLNPLLQAVAFYCFVENLSLRLGQNPDAPEGLKKVTETV